MREKLGEWKRSSAPKERVGVEQNHEKADVICNTRVTASDMNRWGNWKKNKQTNKQRGREERDMPE